MSGIKSDEIAKLAGVSRSTVSRVVNNYANVPEQTRRKVMEIINRYDYMPNTSARALAGKPHNMIGLFIISIAEKDSAHRIYQNSYFAPFMEIIVDELNSRGYYALVSVVYSKDDYDLIRNAFLQKRIDSGIVVGTEAASEVFGEILKRGCPLAIIDLDPGEARKFRESQANLTLVNATDYEGACQAVEFLIGLGHRDIGLLAGRMSTYSGRERYRAYMDSMERAGLPIREEFILRGEFLKSNTVQEVTRLAGRGGLPTALFCCNDDMALNAIEIFRGRGIRVPQDISIVGFDDIAIAGQFNPRLTTVNVPIFEMARKAVDSVIGAVERGDRSQSLVSFPARLIVRDSCARPGEGGRREMA